MRYHNITHDDMNNGTGLRVVLWLAGCSHHCKGCQNPITWDPDGGLPVTEKEIDEIREQLMQPHISGITFSGGDPLHPANREGVRKLIKLICEQFPDKTIWLYTGYTWEEILSDADLLETIKGADVLVEGRFVEALASVAYHWAGSTNQRVIDVADSLEMGTVILEGEVKKHESTVPCNLRLPSE